MDPLHTSDKEYFDNHPSELWESWMRLHPTHINHTTPCFGPMLYWLIRAQGGSNVVEIGVAQGYSSFFMLSAVKDNNTRFGSDGKYIAIDIDDKKYLFDPLIEKGFPVEFWHMDSADLNDKSFINNSLDVVFQDGWHNTEHCLRELDVIYPALKDNGNGYLIIHDVYSWCEEYFKKVCLDKKYNFEYIRFINNYGLAICRKMDNYDYDKIHWPQGDQIKEDGYVK